MPQNPRNARAPRVPRLLRQSVLARYRSDFGSRHSAFLMTDARAWNAYFSDVGLPEDVRNRYVDYISPLIEKKIPVIFEFAHLALLLGKQRSYLASVINNPGAHYREFVIRKRNGGARKISAPYPSLLDCQRWVDTKILLNLPSHGAAHGFRRNRSILTNANEHKGADAVLKMDLENFFPSIGIERVIKVFLRAGYAPNVAFYLARICTNNNCLPQGAATSPALSNCIAFYLDIRLSALAKAAELRFTRYADDLTFSGPRIPASLIQHVETVINGCGFRVNNNKTRLITGTRRRIVTGVDVSGDTLSIPRDYKRRLKQELHYISKFGYLSHIAKKKIRDPIYLLRLRGRLAFWLQVEPHNSTAQQGMLLLRDLLKERRF